jgi:hypothetical protein
MSTPTIERLHNLVRRGGLWRFVRRVPKEYAAFDPRGITIDGGRHTESALHTRFADAFHRGEWFRKTAELLAFIYQINNVKAAA